MAVLKEIIGDFNDNSNHLENPIIKLKLLIVLGARPQFIKHAVFLKEALKKFDCITIHTGQHYDDKMSDIFFSELKIPLPQYFLDPIIENTSLQLVKMIEGVKQVIYHEKPDMIVVYGDTNSTLAGAICASKENIPLAHIEAGLRSYNSEMQEEFNRICTDHIASLLFTPSKQAKENLSKEGIKKGVFIVGDIMKDSLLSIQPEINVSKSQSEYIYATLHRPYNVDDKSRLKAIMNALCKLDLPIIFSIHPRTRKSIQSLEIDVKTYSNISFIDPQPYIDNIKYIKYSAAVITDSGGMQKEAYWLKKKCITIRSETEWEETLKGGANTLIFDNFDEIANVLKNNAEMDFNDDLYGDGNAAKKIVTKIEMYLKKIKLSAK